MVEVVEQVIIHLLQVIRGNQVDLVVVLDMELTPQELETLHQYHHHKEMTAVLLEQMVVVAAAVVPQVPEQVQVEQQVDLVVMEHHLQ